MKSLTAKVNQFLLLWILLIIVLVYGRPVLVPITFGAMLTMLMVPVIDQLDKWGFKRIFSTITCLMVLFVVFGLVVLVLIGQVSSFREDLPEIEDKINSLINSMHNYVAKEYQLTVEEQKNFLQKQVSNFGQSSASYLVTIFTGATGLFVNLAITLVVTFLLLYDKEKYHNFFSQLFKGNNDREKEEVLNSIAKVAQQYLLGRLLSMFALFILYFIALLAIGIEMR